MALLEAMVVSVSTAPHLQFLCHNLSYTIIETCSLDGFFRTSSASTLIDLYASIYIYICFISLQVENELEDLIDELLERDGGSGNSTIIGESPRTEYSFFLCVSLSWEDPFSHHLLAQLCLRAHIASLDCCLS